MALSTVTELRLAQTPVRRRRLRSLVTGPLPILLTSSLLAVAFLAAVSNLVERLG